MLKRRSRCAALATLPARRARVDGVDLDLKPGEDSRAFRRKRGRQIDPRGIAFGAEASRTPEAFEATARSGWFTSISNWSGRLRVWENVAARSRAARADGVSTRAPRARRVTEVAGGYGLPSTRTRSSKTCRWGVAQRVELLRELAREPRRADLGRADRGARRRRDRRACSPRSRARRARRRRLDRHAQAGRSRRSRRARHGLAAGQGRGAYDTARPRARRDRARDGRRRGCRGSRSAPRPSSAPWLTMRDALRAGSGAHALTSVELTVGAARSSASPGVEGNGQTAARRRRRRRARVRGRDATRRDRCAAAIPRRGSRAESRDPARPAARSAGAGWAIAENVALGGRHRSRALRRGWTRSTGTPSRARASRSSNASTCARASLATLAERFRAETSKRSWPAARSRPAAFRTGLPADARNRRRRRGARAVASHRSAQRRRRRLARFVRTRRGARTGRTACSCSIRGAIVGLVRARPLSIARESARSWPGAALQAARRARSVLALGRGRGGCDGLSRRESVARLRGVGPRRARRTAPAFRNARANRQRCSFLRSPSRSRCAPGSSTSEPRDSYRGRPGRGPRGRCPQRTRAVRGRGGTASRRRGRRRVGRDRRLSARALRKQRSDRDAHAQHPRGAVGKRSRRRPAARARRAGRRNGGSCPRRRGFPRSFPTRACRSRCCWASRSPRCCTGFSRARSSATSCARAAKGPKRRGARVSICDGRRSSR